MQKFYQMLRWLCVWLGLALATQTGAQETAVNYGQWAAVAERAEAVLDAGRASESALEALREDVAGWRDQLLRAQDVNADRIATIEDQLAALGPVPDDGEEPEDIATRRAELSSRLSELRAPVLTAQEAYRRADGLVSEIDGRVRSLQADALLRIGPSPLRPAAWPGAIAAVQASIGEIGREISSNWSSDAQRNNLQAAAPRVIFLVLIALGLIVVGRRTVLRMAEQMRGRTRGGTGVWSFLASFASVLLPYLGLLVLTQAATTSGVFGVHGVLLLEKLPYYGLILFGVRWLAHQVFSETEDRAVLRLNENQRAAARAYANILSVFLVLRALIGDLADLDNYDPALRAINDFPFLLICSVILFQLARILANVDADRDPEEPVQNRTRIAGLLSRGAMAIALAGPVMAAVGYTNISEALVYPAIRTLAVLGLLLVLLRFVGDLYELITGRPVDDEQSLVPVFAGLALGIAVIPLLALIWGARVADLTEFWARFREGFSLGDTRISPTDFLVFLVVFVIGYGLTKLLQGTLRNSILPKTRMDIGGQNAVVSGLGYVGIFIAAMVAIGAAGIDLSAFAFVAGALSVGIGFGLQNIVSNFVSGIILLIERPISEGDWIEVNGQMGYVRDISVRSTRIETFDRTDVIVPNGDFISGTVTNYTRGNSIGRVIVPVGVAYGSDTRKVEDILSKIAREHDMVLLNPPPSVVFQGFGADSMDFEIRAILRDVNYMLSVKSDMNHEIAKRFAEEGVEIPFAQRDVWLRNPEILAGPKPEPEDKA